MTMMTLGMFAFERASLPYQRLGRRADWRHAESERFGARPTSQFLGPGADDVELAGVLLPGLAGSYGSLDTIRSMAAQGDAWPLIDGSGAILGRYRIDALDTEGEHFFEDGAARKTDFRLSLARVD
jgi:uncharacterized protein